MVESIQLIGGGLTVESPLDPILGYALQVETPPLSQAESDRFGDDPPTTRSFWGYGTYDCIEAGSDDCTPGDLLIAAGLNGDLNVSRVGALRASKPALDEAFAKLPEASPPFWALDRDEVALPPEGSTSWWMHRAWSVLIRQLDLGIAIAHKTLHHKRPDLFPLIDGKTSPLLGEAKWLRIHDDLTSQPEAWADLEGAFAQTVSRREGCVSLTRLRLHDILLWLHATDRMDEARRQGQALREDS